jgi:hypothetical protein
MQSNRSRSKLEAIICENESSFQTVVNCNKESQSGLERLVEQINLSLQQEKEHSSLVRE